MQNDPRRSEYIPRGVAQPAARPSVRTQQNTQPGVQTGVSASQLGTQRPNLYTQTPQTANPQAARTNPYARDQYGAVGTRPRNAHAATHASAQTNKKPVGMIVAAVIAGVLLVAGVIVVAFVLPNMSSSQTQSGSSLELSDTKLSFTKYSAETADSFPAAPDVRTTFNLRGDTLPTLDEAQAAIVDQLVTKCQKEGDVGYVLFNLDTGKGIAYNLDESIYGASAIKGIFCTYVCEALVDNGKATLDDSLKDKITKTIVNSDNSCFRSLRASYNASGWSEWCDNLGLSEVNGQDQSTVKYTTRASAKMWLHIWEYLNSDTPTAAWLKTLFEQTDYSFIKMGLEAADTTDAYVVNKAGYYNPDNGDPAQFSTCDTGIVQVGEQTYLYSIMTSMRWTIINTDTMTEFVGNLWKLHAALN